MGDTPDDEATTELKQNACGYDAVKNEVKIAIEEAEELKREYQRVQRGGVGAAMLSGDDALSQGFCSAR